MMKIDENMLPETLGPAAHELQMAQLSSHMDRIDLLPMLATAGAGQPQSPKAEAAHELLALKKSLKKPRMALKISEKL